MSFRLSAPAESDVVQVPSPVREMPIPGFRRVPFTGVIHATAEAARRGYRGGDPSWCNLGQGQPEAGPLPGAPARVGSIEIAPDDQEYAPVAGLWELREAVAAHYNSQYRRGLPSQYGPENVCICGGGRVSLARTAAALGHVNLGHFLPDYTAYEELLDVFKLFTAIPILLDSAAGYHFSRDDLRREIVGRGLSVVLLSNPANPTGHALYGDELRQWVEIGRNLNCTLLIDEFYSHYSWVASPPLSAAAYVEDVNRDPVVLFDGLTKNWRYPGWRCSWIVGPAPVIEAVSSTGSFLDGGGSRPTQRRVIPLLEPDHVKAEVAAISAAFRPKRHLMLDGLRRAGVRFDIEPEGTFYCWGDVSDLPPALSTGKDFFQHALDRQVICVPGEFFDVNPGRRRSGRPSRFRHYVRFSFGPEIGSVREGVARIQAMVQDHGGTIAS